MKNGGARDLLNFKPQEKEDTDDQEKEPPEVQYKTIVRNAVNDYLYLEKYMKELKHGEEPLMHNTLMHEIVVNCEEDTLKRLKKLIYTGICTGTKPQLAKLLELNRLLGIQERFNIETLNENKVQHSEDNDIIDDSQSALITCNPTEFKNSKFRGLKSARVNQENKEERTSQHF